MSYLGYPRLHFRGKFQADPSTINNTPDNYSPTEQDLVLGWNPNGTGVFDFSQCQVSKVVYGPGDEATTPEQDSLVGQSVAAVYSKGAPKLVDLDPMQQLVSEIWALTLKVGGITAKPGSLAANVSGDYIEGPFDAMWGQAQSGYPSSVRATAYYQSTLKNLSWDLTGEASQARAFLTALQQVSQDRLSINFNVLAHNNKPPNYLFNNSTFAAMLADNIPQDVVDKLKQLPAQVPTQSYLNLQLQTLLGQGDAGLYGSQILSITAEPYTPASDNEFTFGDVIGTIGPLSNTELTPVYYTPARIMSPKSNTKSNLAPFVVNNQAGDSRVILNLGNALATIEPGLELSPEFTGELFLVYFDQTQASGISSGNAITFARLPSDLQGELTTAAGIIELIVDPNLLPAAVTQEQANQALLNSPLGLIGAKDSSGQMPIWLAENVQGYALRADQFVYRMNPELVTGEQQPRGNTAQVEIYVTAFGNPAANVEVLMSTPEPQTSGPNNAAGALTINQSSAFTDADGVARFTLTATNPGDPRDYIDGQVYFIPYQLSGQADLQPKNKLSVQVYQDQSTEAQPTWDGIISSVLSQYGQLYPIMERFELSDYDAVVKNAVAIKTVLSKPMADGLHMPVTRDLSVSRRELILKWIDSGMAKN